MFTPDLLKKGAAFLLLITVGLMGFVALSDAASVEKTASFVAALAALVQVWIAGLMWLLAKKQFEFTASSARLSARSQTYELRANLMRRWQTVSGQIGKTALNSENVTAMGQLLTEIRRVFGEETAGLAQNAIQAARQARARAHEVEREGRPLKEDQPYRDLIETFRDHKFSVWRSMDDHLRIADQDIFADL